MVSEGRIEIVECCGINKLLFDRFFISVSIEGLHHDVHGSCVGRGLMLLIVFLSFYHVACYDVVRSFFSLVLCYFYYFFSF